MGSHRTPRLPGGRGASDGGSQSTRKGTILIPVLFQLGPFSVRSYGLMLAVAFVAGTWYAVRGARRRGLSEDRILSLVGWILVAALLGARLHFVLGHPESYASPLEFLRIWEGGLTLYGGLIAAIAVSFLYLRRHGIPFLPVADLCAPAIALGESITRIGCFLNGCCFGAPCSGGLCIHYPPGSYAVSSLGDVPVHPAQLYLSASMLAVFGFLAWLDRRHHAPGVIFSCFLIAQGLARYIVDFFRYYEPVDQVAALGPAIHTKSQVVALALVMLGVVLAMRTRNAARRANALEAGS